MNSLISCVLLISMTLFGGIAAYSDIHQGTVPNRWLIKGIGVSIVFQVLSVILDQRFLLSWSITFLLAGSIAILLYIGGLWAAGDAKLLLYLFLCIPQSLIEPGSYIQGILIYFFIFIPAFCWIVIDSVLLTIRKDERFSPPSITGKQIITVLSIAIEVLSIDLLIQQIFPRFYIENRMLVSVLMLIIGYSISNTVLFRKYSIFFLFAVTLTVLLLQNHISLNPSMVKTYLPLSIILLIRNWASGFNYKRIQTSDVKPGMILSSGTTMLFSRSRVKGLPTFSLENMDSRLTEKEADAVQRWGKSVFGKSTVIIVRKLPFAILIFFGFILWVLVRYIGRQG